MSVLEGIEISNSVLGSSSARWYSTWVSEPARVLMALQVAAIVVLGVATMLRFRIPAEVDEHAHLAYVQEVAERGRIPWVGHDYVPWQELAFEQGTYPRSSGLDPRSIGLRGISYEGWQPPLYYALAAPAFLIPSNYRDKILAVRAFDLLLTLVAVAILALLARAVFREHWRVPCCTGLAVMLWPAVIVRAITISNAALELPMVLLYLLVVWNATTRPRARSVVATGGLLGLCVLTQLTLVCLALLLAFPIAALLREHRKGRKGRALGAALVTLVLPLALVSPWLALNESRYGALSASSIEERLTAGAGPSGPRSGLSAVVGGLDRLTRVALPQEWWQEYRGALAAILIALAALLLLGALPIVRDPRLLRSRVARLLGSPLLLGLATLTAIVLLADWPAALFPRYLNPMLAPFALFTAWAWTQTDRQKEKPLLTLAAVSSSITGLVWVYMAAAYYFPHVGGALGIHAATLA